MPVSSRCSLRHVSSSLMRRFVAVAVLDDPVLLRLGDLVRGIFG